MKKIIFSLATCVSAFVATSCKDNIEEISIPDDQKTKIDFSLSDGSSNYIQTRDGFTGVDGNTNNQNTFISALFVSEKSTSEIRHTKTVLQAAPENNGNKYSEITYPQQTNIRYWDDAYGRAAKISVYAIAVPNKASAVTNNSKTLDQILTEGTNSVSSSNPNWKTGDATTTMTWKVSTDQSSNPLSTEDLCYSNNIQSDGTLGVYGRRVWGTHNFSGYPDFSYVPNPTQGQSHYPNCDNGALSFKLVDSQVNDGPGHFDLGHMIFNHALSRLTIDLYVGDGFNMDAETKPFDFATNTNIKLYKMPVNGTFNVKTGKWNALTDANKADVTKMFCSAKSTSVTESNKSTTPIYTLSAQIVPGYEFNSTATTNNVMSFEIDGHNYYVTSSQIYDALKANSTSNGLNASETKYTMENGRNYHLSITVSKKKIDELTATLVDWVDVAGSLTANNAHITFTSLVANSNASACSHFDIYRIKNESNTASVPGSLGFDGTSNYKTGYNNDNKLSTDGTSPTVTSNGTANKWKTTWFWENNKSFYHFRTVNPNLQITKDENNGDYFTMYSGPVNDTYPTSGTPSYPTNVIGGNENVSNWKFNDYHWGAIFKTGVTLKYDQTKGYEDKLEGPVGPTKSELSIIEQHMMSKINVVLLTPSEGTELNSAANLYVSASGSTPAKVSKIKLTNFAGSATVRMGDGKITPVGLSSFTNSVEMTTPSFTAETEASDNNNYCVSKVFQFGNNGQKYYKTKEYSYCVVPQKLVVEENGTTKKVGLVIETPDNNMYYVVDDLATIKPSSVTGSNLKDDHKTTDAIDTWYPGYTYTYYFILKKTGIQALTCTIVDWVKVDAKPIDIDLEH